MAEYALLIELPIDRVVVVADPAAASAQRIETEAGVETQVLRADAVDDRAEAIDASEDPQASSEITDARGDVD